MKSLLVLIVAAVVLVGCMPSEADRALLEAAKAGNTKVVKQHLAAGADINAINGALNQATVRGHKEIVKLLIDKGADVNARDKFGWTPLDRAELRNHKEIANLLRKHGGKKTK